MTRLALALTLAACTQAAPASQASPASSVNFELTCAAANTDTASQVHCTRTDTRTGDVVVVEALRLPVTTGPTATGGTIAGRFTTVCEATSMSARADFYCIRMNTETGELTLVNLTKVPTLPPKS